MKVCMKVPQCIKSLGVNSRRFCSLVVSHSHFAARKLIMLRVHKHSEKPIDVRTKVEEEEEEEDRVSSPKMPSLRVDDAASSSRGGHENAAKYTADCEVAEEQASVRQETGRINVETEPGRTCNSSPNWNSVKDGTGVEEDEEPGSMEVDRTSNSNQLRGIRFSNGGFQVDFLIVKK